MNDSREIQVVDYYAEGEPLTPLDVHNEQDTLGGGYLTPIDVGEPSTPLEVRTFQPTLKGSKFWVPKVYNKPLTPVECVNGVLREIYGNVKDSVTHLVTNIQKLHIYKDELATLLEQVKIDIPNALEINKKELYVVALGANEPAQVEIVSLIYHNKGTVSVKRQQTQAEKAMIQSNRNPRTTKVVVNMVFNIHVTVIKR
ncbi:hypothetical protein Tco_0650080 [Tanacetum coccineum]